MSWDLSFHIVQSRIQTTRSASEILVIKSSNCEIAYVSLGYGISWCVEYVTSEGLHPSRW